MATNAENIELTGSGIELIEELLGAMIGNTQIIQEAQEALNAVHGDHEENISLNKGLEYLANVKGKFEEDYKLLNAGKEVLEAFKEGLESLQG